MKTVVNPIKPVAPYIGGKFHLSKTIINAINTIPHTCYAEPFVGMGGIFLRRPEKATCEVINDYNKEISNFFRILQRHYIPFMEMMRFQITTRAEFERLLKTDPDTLTDLEQAARFLYIQRTVFGGQLASKFFGITATRQARFDIIKLAPMLEDLHTRLASVVIECLPYEEFIKRYDRESTLFYLDPPYYQCEDYYGKGMFNRDDFTLIAELFANIKGRFIMSINDVPKIRSLYSDFNIEVVKTIYTTSTKLSKKTTELLISN